MKSHDLAAILLDGPNLEVMHIWDGAARTTIEFVWLASGEDGAGFIATADYGAVVYNEEDRPDGSPTAFEDAYWSTPDKGDEIK